VTGCSQLHQRALRPCHRRDFREHVGMLTVAGSQSSSSDVATDHKIQPVEPRFDGDEGRRAGCLAVLTSIDRLKPNGHA